MENIRRKHWSDNVGWEIAQVMHHNVSLQPKKTIHATRFLAISCDEVMTIDN